ncbi:hypothetical protein AWJ14_04635 [Hoeflea olei]|uniref:N-acetyltransferase domain-containing protein n=2 Tax=Hoeflea olei TaxID=1480615 RepID=A0A1C1YZY0_9HYPH|nr:hypothetical protein AWJ14_04635 [Hoeflea olei]
MDYYAPAWGFGLGFETKLAAELSAFLAGLDPARDLFATAWRDGRLIGSISMDVSGGGPRGAHLRWFVVSDAARGTGLGRRLLEQAIAHADAVSAGPVWLTTFAGLDAARALYERFGFRLAEELDRDQWQGGVTEQLFVRPAPVSAQPDGSPDR